MKNAKVPKLTPFGRELRKLRIDHGETLGDLADTLKVYSVTFLSAVETGRKNVPAGFVKRITEHYKLEAARVRRLVLLAEQSQREVKISLERSSDDAREIVAQFARSFSTLSDAKRKKIKQLLARHEKE